MFASRSTIQAAARQIESLISRPTHPDAPRLREMVRSMLDRITIGRPASGALEVGCSVPLRA